MSPTDPDLTRLSDADRGPARTGLSITTWGSTTDIDHGRFTPGALLDNRYRIVGRLGKGGMGEVYRADDLRLGQPVALKFLPESVGRDPVRLSQLHAEVRMARQVSHPNVCRVYDIGEWEGHTFLSMEYVDGEDLASLLRRIGRFPQDRGVALGRQICAGLAAAHDRGVVHRDLKPANIMLDGNGRIRITDFGLAGTAGEVLRAGTPAYMAPEQLAGREVTPRSDIYALGLVLYEIFTGQRALEAANMAELIARREQGAIAPPIEIVRDLDPGLDRAIMRCLSPDPGRRPATALAVAAALPGGDPLAAALAAGETPSPEMVAAAGAGEHVSTRVVALTAGCVVLLSLAILAIYQHVLMINRAPMPKPPAALTDRAQEIVQKLGYGDKVRSTASGLGASLEWAQYLNRTTSDPHRWDRLRTVRPETHIFWYRTSPLPLVPVGNENGISGLNPPLLTEGMTLTVVDMNGRLSEFLAVPAPYQPAGPDVPTDFSKLFDAAGLDMRAFTPVAPQWVPAVFASERKAWEGRLPEEPEIPVRIEAAGAWGLPVAFEITGPWSQSGRTPTARQQPLFNRILANLTSLVMPGLMLVAALFARRNLKSGRGDRRGAFRAAAAVVILTVAAWCLSDVHVSVPAREMNRFFSQLGEALFNASLLWLAYIGLEPYVRRFAPDSLVGWTRLIAGGWRDPVVGRDIAFGISAGLLMTLAFAVHNLVPPLVGRPEPIPVAGGSYAAVVSVRYALALLFVDVQNAMTSSMLGIGGFVAFRVLLRGRLPAALAAIVCFTPVVLDGMFAPGNPLLDLVSGVLITAGFVIVIGWAGLLATIAALATHFILLRAPLTMDVGSWRAPATFVLLGSILVLGLAACYTASTASRHPRTI